jgi:hypothetical protein
MVTEDNNTMNKLQNDLFRRAIKGGIILWEEVEGLARLSKKYDNLTLRQIDEVVKEIEKLSRKLEKERQKEIEKENKRKQKLELRETKKREKLLNTNARKTKKNS